jgi:hypothetical protein
MTTLTRAMSSAGTNAYSLECEFEDRVVRANYAICQHTLKAAARGDLRGFEQCVAKFRSRTCPALTLMREEKNAGKALYYEEYGVIAKLRDQEMGGNGRLRTSIDERTVEQKAAEGEGIQFDPAKILAKASSL